MVELKVAAKETVKITFGGSGGWAPCDYTVTQDDLSHLRQMEHDVEVVRSDSQAMQVRLASAIRERDSYKDDNTKLGNENDRLAGTIARQTDEIMRLREVCCRPLPPAAGTPVYMINQELADRLKALTTPCEHIHATTPEWQPIATAPKDGTTLLIYCERRGEHVGKWLRHKECWIVTGGDSIVPTHWMPLPEPPR